ncbi:LysR family transcriptional regulator [uncultured Roseibium sp.]|uniref:LysR family transcriptional regulator n=1 Tax=uncultured Roseibium sp. TaxID=1936171 RepID=UPI0026055093|nr:LysR family transcriptional regulator [uncultured Roseibium sp.]
MRFNNMSLKGIEVFCIAAETGSIAQAAAETDLSLPAASQQIKKLEQALGCRLLDRNSRPMTMTRAGQLFLERAKTAMGEIHLAQTELISLDLSGHATLRIGAIEDFEDQITPMLLSQLASSLTRSEFRLLTGPSHEIEDKLRTQSLDIGIYTSSGEIDQDIEKIDLLSDPYVLAVPSSAAYPPQSGLQDLKDLQYITYDRRLLMGRQIEAQLSRLRLTQEVRVEIDSYQSLFALIATGQYWSITTPLAYKSARRFHKDIDIHPLPFQAFSRTIVLAAGPEWSRSLGDAMARTLKGFLHSHTVTPVVSEYPWLGHSFKVAG